MYVQVNYSLKWNCRPKVSCRDKIQANLTNRWQTSTNFFLQLTFSSNSIENDLVPPLVRFLQGINFSFVQRSSTNYLNGTLALFSPKLALKLQSVHPWKNVANLRMADCVSGKMEKTYHILSETIRYSVKVISKYPLTHRSFTTLNYWFLNGK